MRSNTALLAAIFVLLPLNAQAESRSVSVAANRTSPIGGFSIFVKSTCYHGGQVDYRVSKQPAHGTVRVTYQKMTLGKEAGKCAGREAGGMVVLYTPERGYRGKDNASVTFVFPRYVGGHAGLRDSKRYDYRITVK